jgi:hypothetical protein
MAMLFDMLFKIKYIDCPDGWRRPFVPDHMRYMGIDAIVRKVRSLNIQVNLQTTPEPFKILDCDNITVKMSQDPQPRTTEARLLLNGVEKCTYTHGQALRPCRTLP